VGEIRRAQHRTRVRITLPKTASWLHTAQDIRLKRGGQAQALGDRVTAASPPTTAPAMILSGLPVPKNVSATCVVQCTDCAGRLPVLARL
jgi:hypothetical protein